MCHESTKKEENSEEKHCLHFGREDVVVPWPAGPIILVYIVHHKLFEYVIKGQSLALFFFHTHIHMHKFTHASTHTPINTHTHTRTRAR